MTSNPLFEKRYNRHMVATDRPLIESDVPYWIVHVYHRQKLQAISAATMNGFNKLPVSQKCTVDNVQSVTALRRHVSNHFYCRGVRLTEGSLAINAELVLLAIAKFLASISVKYIASMIIIIKNEYRMS